MAALPVRPLAGSATMNTLFDLLVADYAAHERRSAPDMERRVKLALRPALGDLKASDLTSSHVKKLVQDRLDAGLANASVNKELAFLRRALNLGASQEPPLLDRVIRFKLLPVDNAREGTLPRDRYTAIRDALPPHARIAFVISYHTGARRGEILAILKDKIDLAQGKIFLPGRTTKNGRPRYLPIYGDMIPELNRSMAATAGAACPYLVQRNGRPVQSFYKAWKSVVKDKTILHDLRRTALTLMIEAGLSEKEAMEISGHRTRYVFNRYHIVSDERMKENAAKLERHLAFSPG
jgi:integrase